jgi:hypothetical protein
MVHVAVETVLPFDKVSTISAVARGRFTSLVKWVRAVDTIAVILLTTQPSVAKPGGISGAVEL